VKYNYLTMEESAMPSDSVDLQVVLGLQECKTKEDALKLLQDIRKHERFIMELIIREQFGSLILDIMKKEMPDWQTPHLQTAKVNTLHFLEEEILARMRK
jgi:hypothetical protein